MRVALIVNPVSGAHHGRATALGRRTRAFEDLARRAGGQVTTLVTRGPGHATELAAEAVTQGADLVVAWGGDGTMNEVATALVGTGTPLALVPAGSGSGLARALGIPLDWQGALDVALRGSTRRIDVGRAGGRTFVNVAGVGFDAAIARAFNEDRLARPGRRGLLSYVRITLREFLRYEPMRCRVSVGGTTREVDALLVAFANSSQYGNGACIAPDARVDDGAADIVVVEATGPFKDLLRARRLFDGSIARDARAFLHRAAVATIEAERPMAFHTDGEPREGGERLDVEMRPRALSIKVPSDTRA